MAQRFETVFAVLELGDRREMGQSRRWSQNTLGTGEKLVGQIHEIAQDGIGIKCSIKGTYAYRV